MRWEIGTVSNHSKAIITSQRLVRTLVTSTVPVDNANIGTTYALIGVNLSKPHINGTALQDGVCMFVRGHIPEFKSNKWIRTFQICTHTKARPQPVGMKEAWSKVNAHMAIVDHDRQGQAAQRRCCQITHSSSVCFRCVMTLIRIRDSAHDFIVKFSPSMCCCSS